MPNMASDTQFDRSLFKIYSIAVVVKDKEEDTNKIIVTPLEHLNNIGENLTTYKKKIKIALKDWERVTKVNITKRVRHEAEWLNLGDDTRVTAPDVCKGEMVVLYRMADEERFFWVVKEKNYLVRKLEHVTWQYNNTPKDLQDAGHLGVIKKRKKPKKKEYTGKGGRMPSDTVFQFPKDNIDDAKSRTYWFEVSTRDKHILLQTSDNDEELTIYQIKLDTKKGILSIRDKQRNSIVIDSVPRQITLTALDVNIEANLFVRGNVNVNDVMKVDASNGNTWIGGGAKVDGNALVDGDITTLSDLYSKGMSFLNGMVSMGDNANVAKTLTCGAIIVTGPFSALGMAAFGGGGGSPGTVFSESGAIKSEEPADFANSVSVTGGMSADTADVSGAMSAGSADVSGTMTAATADVTGAMTAGSAAVSGDVSAGSLASDGAISGTTGDFSSGVTGTTGDFSGEVSSPTLVTMDQALVDSETASSHARAMDAQTAADATTAAAQTAADAATAAAGATTAGGDALTAAQDAQTAATAAQDAADAASTEAEDAQTTADVAAAAAIAAQTAADAATADAAAAVECCNTHMH